MTSRLARVMVLFVMVPASALAIVGGKTVHLNQGSRISSVLAILNQESGEICSGTLIRDHVVLTAAHCLGNSASALFVYAGDKVDAPQAFFIADAAVKHAKYNGQITRDENDLALVHFNGVLPKGVHVAKLMADSDQLPADAKFWLAGYGVSTAKNGGQGDGILRQTQVRLDKSDYSGSEFTVDQSQGSGSCFGDSGGPAFVEIAGELRLAGVLSRPEKAALDCRPAAIYSKVSVFREWIERNSQALAVKSKALEEARFLKH